MMPLIVNHKLLAVVFMRQLKIITFIFFVIGLTSCDHTMYIAVRNYKEPCKVNVAYQKDVNSFFDTDTLLLKPIGNSKFDSSLIRVNTSAFS